MTFLELAKERYSVRKYLHTPVENEKLQYILEAGRVAPTALNKQPQRFLVITSPAGKEKLQKACDFHGAPMAIVVCALNDQAWIRPQDNHPMTEIDPTIAATQMMFAAWEQGIGSCWITWFDPEVIRAEFALPENVEPVDILALGYADSPVRQADRHDKKRIPLSAMVWMEEVPTSL